MTASAACLSTRLRFGLVFLYPKLSNCASGIQDVNKAFLLKAKTKNRKPDCGVGEELRRCLRFEGKSDGKAGQGAAASSPTIVAEHLHATLEATLTRRIPIISSIKLKSKICMKINKHNK